MKISIETDDLSIDFVAEIFRAMIFQQDGNKYLGCYSSFELKPDFVILPKGERFNKYYKKFFGEFYEDEYFNSLEATHCFENYQFIVMWHWDGDGCLGIYHKNSGRIYVNYDCKCTYGWKTYKYGVDKRILGCWETRKHETL